MSQNIKRIIPVVIIGTLIAAMIRFYVRSDKEESMSDITISIHSPDSNSQESESIIITTEKISDPISETGYKEIPNWCSWEEKQIQIDQTKKLVLENKKVRIIEGEDVFWELPDDVYVQDALWFDIDGQNKQQDANEAILSDGILSEANEIVVLCWKKGRYGEKSPSWIDEDFEKDIFSQHIFVYNITEKRVRARWMSSYIGTEVKTMNNMENCLILKSPEGNETEWKWKSWGFEKIN